VILEVKIDIDKLLNFDDVIEIKQTNNTQSSHYDMSLSKFIEAISSGVELSNNESPLLPSNCVKYVQLTTGYKVYCVIPKKQWMINYHGNHFKVGFPKMVFEYNISARGKMTANNSKKYAVQLTKIVAVKDQGPVKKDTQVFNFPYSHVNDLNASVCMGGTEIRDIDCLSELETFHSYFLDSPFTEDYGAKLQSTTTLHMLFSDVFNERDFKDQLLVPYGKNFSEFFNLTNE
jgi:hypothetical protein